MGEGDSGGLRVGSSTAVCAATLVSGLAWQWMLAGPGGICLLCTGLAELSRLNTVK